VAQAERIAAPGYRLTVTRDPAEAARGTHVLYTDVWASMGQEAEAEARRAIFMPYQLNTALVSVADPDVLVMHCLPAHRGEEITADVLDGPRSVVFDEAENRLHVQKALLLLLLRHVTRPPARQRRILT
jgi:ornithine carbamoyltransferase